jgi:hypothetical protein
MKHVLGGWWRVFGGPAETWHHKTDLGQLVGHVRRLPCGSWNWGVAVPPRLHRVIGVVSVGGFALTRLDAMRLARVELRRLIDLAAVPLAQQHRREVR